MYPPKKKSKGNTLKDCELEFKARRAKYEHLNLFSKYDMNLHITALYNRYGERNLEPRNCGLRINFTLEDLDDEYHISLVNSAIAKHNKEAEDNAAKLAFEELIFIDTCRAVSYLEYHLFFVARNLSKHELGGYYAEVHATYPDEHIHVESFCCLRNGEVDGSWSHKIKRQLRLDGSESSSDESGFSSDESGSSSDESRSSSDKSSMGMKSNANEDGSGSLCEKGKQSNESSIGVNIDDSIGILSDRGQAEDGSGSSCEKGKKSDECCRGMKSNANEDGSGSTCEKGKQSNVSSIGMNIDSIEILSDRISTPILITGPSKNTEGKTLKDCELELKARRTKYEHLNLFSKYHMKLHIKALYDGYRRDQKNLQHGHYGLRINFTLEDLEDEYHITLVKFAIAKHNQKVEDNCRLTFEQLLFLDTSKSQSYVEYHFFFVARNISKELGGYYAEVKATGTDTVETIHAQYFCRLRNTNEGGSGSSCEKVKQSHESSVGINSDSIGVLSHRIPTPIQIEDQLGRPKKAMDKKRKLTMEDRIEKYNKRQNRYDNLHFLTDHQKLLNVHALKTGYKQRKRLKRCLKTGRFGSFPKYVLAAAFTLEELDDEYHKILVEYAIAKHNKKVNDNSKLALVELIYFNACNICCGRSSRRYDFCFVARNKSNTDELGAYRAEVYAIFPHQDILVKRLSPFRGQIEDESGSSSDESGSSSR